MVPTNACGVTARFRALFVPFSIGNGGNSPVITVIEIRPSTEISRFSLGSRTPLIVPYRKEGRKAPDRAPKLIASMVETVGRISNELDVDPTRLVLGGRSMGGRMASMAIAEGLSAAGVVLVAYPLHPPGKPEKLRTDHLGDLGVPSLWLCGDRDPFGTPAEVSAAQQLVDGPVTSRTLPGRHELKGGDPVILAEVRDWLGFNRGNGPR